ncbi:HupE/UreJ family protein [Erythrobacter mangrovi]|uniref:HupE/UreJ family protein n=1 Tax=Erythrobacter mangrovi TaxID=2739433 RepID=A0A7D3Y1C1_9SPHN|nr:HupE/UreJ family protein [Erythrobacter mangrovi]QKG72352.1 HupE/UreJ family protein [Erythrobacter mangrovi]
MIRWLAVLLLALMGASPALADELRPVSIQFEQRDANGWRVAWKQPLSSPADDRFVMPTLPRDCRITSEPKREMAALAVLGSAEVACAGEVAGQPIGWPNLVGQGDAILRIVPLDRPEQVYRLTAGQPTAVFAARPAAAQVWRSYFVIGVEHILAGWDHLLFVIALVLLVEKPGPVVKAATAFTIAHSLTLAAVTLGFAGLPQRPVEALIALSIVFLAVEVAKDGRSTLARRLPWFVAFVFGLLHGFGFAGALHEIGLPEGEVPAALVSFNLGVEAGQLLVILGVLLLRAALRRSAPRVETPALRLATYAIGITGSFWLIERIAG